jgi:hypothetical protein
LFDIKKLSLPDLSKFSSLLKNPFKCLPNPADILIRFQADRPVIILAVFGRIDLLPILKITNQIESLHAWIAVMAA